MNNDWSFTEATNDEFDKNRHDMTYYRIFLMNPEGKEENVYKFWAKDVDAAYSKLVDYIHDHNDGNKYYVDVSGYYVDNNGNHYDHIEDAMKYDYKPTITESIMDFIWDSRCYRRWFVDLKFFIMDLVYWLKYRRNRTEAWNIGPDMLEMLRFNLPLLIKDKNGYPGEFDVEARARNPRNEGENDEDYNIRMSHAAAAIWVKKLTDLYISVVLYDYYTGYCELSDGNNAEHNEIVKKYGHGIPYIKGTRNHIDYPVISRYAVTEWNKIWDWIKEYGEGLWD